MLTRQSKPHHYTGIPKETSLHQAPLLTLCALLLLNVQEERVTRELASM